MITDPLTLAIVSMIVGMVIGVLACVIALMICTDLGLYRVVDREYPTEADVEEMHRLWDEEYQAKH